jgi:hypothetical protein
MADLRPIVADDPLFGWTSHLLANNPFTIVGRVAAKDLPAELMFTIPMSLSLSGRSKPHLCSISSGSD